MPDAHFTNDFDRVETCLNIRTLPLGRTLHQLELSTDADDQEWGVGALPERSFTHRPTGLNTDVLQAWESALIAS